MKYDKGSTVGVTYDMVDIPEDSGISYTYNGRLIYSAEEVNQWFDLQDDQYGKYLMSTNYE